jgi:parallel beta-helix repeat protein
MVYFLNPPQGNTIHGNQIIGFSGSSLAVPTGIWVSSSSNNRIESNNVSSNVEYGILVQAASTGNIISGNIITGNGVGLVLDYCPNNVLRDNQIYGNEHNFKLGYNTYSQFVQDIDSSNLIEGKPVYYWIDEHDKTVPSDAGFVALGNCTNIRVEGLEIRNNYDSITLINTNNSVILDNYLEKCGNGIFLKYCHDVTVTGNTITGNVESGIATLAGSNIEISENIIDSSRYGISTAGQTSQPYWRFWISQHNNLQKYHYWLFPWNSSFLFQT